MNADDLVLDDPDALAAADPGQMLRATASAGAQVRLGAAGLDRDALARVAADGRPRALAVAGMGGSGISADVLDAVTGPGSPVQITEVRDYVLPGWASPLDLVVAVSCSGSTEETLAVAEEAARRGCRLVGVGAAGSPLADLVAQARGEFLAVDAGGRLPRANVWALSTPLLGLADALGLAEVPDALLQRAADALDERAEAFGPVVPLAANPAKALGLELAESLPMVWGTSRTACVAGTRLACQLAENAKLPAVVGALPEANHNQVVAFDGPLAAGGGGAGDLFRDRVDEPGPAVALRLVLVRDTEEHPQVARRAEVSRELAQARGVAVSELRAAGGHTLLRLASLLPAVDYASVYAALALGVDPSPIVPIDQLKARIAAGRA